MIREGAVVFVSVLTVLDLWLLDSWCCDGAHYRAVLRFLLALWTG